MFHFQVIKSKITMYLLFYYKHSTVPRGGSRGVARWPGHPQKPFGHPQNNLATWAKWPHVATLLITLCINTKNLLKIDCKWVYFKKISRFARIWVSGTSHCLKSLLHNNEYSKNFGLARDIKSPFNEYYENHCETRFWKRYSE